MFIRVLASKCNELIFLNGLIHNNSTHRSVPVPVRVCLYSGGIVYTLMVEFSVCVTGHKGNLSLDVWN